MYIIFEFVNKLEIKKKIQIKSSYTARELINMDNTLEENYRCAIHHSQSLIKIFC